MKNFLQFIFFLYILVFSSLSQAAEEVIDNNPPSSEVASTKTINEPQKVSSIPGAIIIILVVYFVFFRKKKKGHHINKQSGETDRRLKKQWKKLNKSQKSIGRFLFDNVGSGTSLAVISELKQKARECDVSDQMLKSIILYSLAPITKKALGEGILSEENEKWFDDIFKQFEIEANDLGEESKLLLVKGRLIRDLMNCKINPKMQLTQCPFSFQKSEILIWAFNNIPLAMLKNRTQYVGKSKGFSIPVARGMYWRLGNSKGEFIK